jgi:hypothetical protein
VGAAAQLAFTTQPGGGTAGTAWSTQPVVTVQDAGGNTVTSSSASITLAIGTNPGSGVLTCTGGLSKSASSGVATFAGCAISLGGTGYTLTASATSLTGATSSTFNVQDFTLSSSPTSGSVTHGSSYTYTPGISLTNLGGFSGSVTLACQGVTPTSGTPITCSNVTFGTNPISGTTTSTVKVTTSGSTTHVAYTITISGTYSGIPTRTVAVTLTVN